LIGIASSSDVRRRRDVLPQYKRILGWDEVADLAFVAGGSTELAQGGSPPVLACLATDTA
jgi:hypothetical protein